ncbi:unnamed protein product [Closterium sp. NIES-54]
MLLAHGATGATGTLATGATGTRATGVTGSAANSERQEQRTHGRLEQRAHGQLEQRAHGRLAQRSHGRLELLASRRHSGNEAPGPSAPRPQAPRPLGLSAPATAATATAATTVATAATAATAAPACCVTMASLRVLAFDHEGRPVQIDTWLDNLQLYLLSDSKDSVSLFDLVSGAATAPPATADSATRSQWLTRDAAARLAIRNHLPLAECAHFGQHRTAQALYDAVVTRYSSPATAATARAPPMFITLYFIVTRLPDSLRFVRDHFLSLDPTSLTVDLLKQHLLAADTSAVSVGAARGTPRPPFFEGCSPSPLAPSYASAAAADVSVAEEVRAASASAKRRSSKGKGGRGGGAGSGGGGGGSGSGGWGSSGGGGGGGTGGENGGSGGGGGGSGGSGGSGGGGTGGGRTRPRHGGPGGGQRQQQQRRSETQSLQQLREWLLQRRMSRGSDSCPYVIRTGGRAGQTCGKLHTQHCCFSRLDDAWRAEFGDVVERPRWADLLRSGVAFFDLDFDVILSAMYALSASAKGDCYRCVPPDPSIAAAALGASESGTLPGTAPAEALHTFMLDSGASRCFFRDSTTLTPLPAPVPVRLADPSRGPVVARSSTILPCPAVPSGSLSVLLLPSFSTNLVSTAALQNAMVTTTTPGGQCVSICTCTRTGRHLATFTRRPGSSLYTLTTEPPQVAASAQVSASGQVAASCSCRLLSHQTLLWHHRLGHPSLPRLRGMHSRLLVSGLPRSLPPLPPLPAPPCLPCVEGWQRAAPHSSSFPPTTAPLQTLHMDSISSSASGSARTFLSCVCTLTEVPFAIWYAAHQLNLWPRVSLPETSPTLRWTGKVGDASVFRVRGSRAFVRDTSADKLSARAIPCVPFYRLFPYRSAPPPPPPLFLPPGPPPVDPLPPQCPAPSGVSQVDPLPGTAPVEVAVSSDPARGAASGGAACGGAEPGGAGSEGAGCGGAEPVGEEPRGAEPEGVEPGDAEPEGVEPGGADSEGAESRCAASSGGPAGASPRLSQQQVREWLVRRACLRSGATGAGSARDARAGRVEVTARTGGAGGSEAGGAGVGGTCTGGAGDTGAGAVDPGAGGAGGTVRRSPASQPPLLSASPLPAPSPYTEQSGGLTERREPVSCLVLPVCTAHCVPRSRLPSVPGMHAMALRPYSVLDPESDRARAASPTVSRLLATAVTDSSFESAAVSALVGELLDFAAACRLDYATALIAESAFASPPSVGGECALGTDVLEERQEDFECLAAAVPCFASMLLAPEGDPDAPDISTPRSYAEAITGPSALRLLVLLTTAHSSVYQPLVLSSTFERVRRAEWSVPRACGLPHRSSQGYTFSLGSGSVSWRSTRSSSVLSTSCEAEIFVGAMAAQELCWLAYLLTDLGEQPRLPPVLYVDNKAMIALCQEHRLEHRTKHIPLRYFLARELQQHGQLRLAYVATRANTADIFTKALPPGDHQRFSTVLGLVPTLPHLLTA